MFCRINIYILWKKFCMSWSIVRESIESIETLRAEFVTDAGRPSSVTNSRKVITGPGEICRAFSVTCWDNSEICRAFSVTRWNPGEISRAFSVTRWDKSEICRFENRPMIDFQIGNDDFSRSPTAFSLKEMAIFLKIGSTDSLCRENPDPGRAEFFV